jgi:phosphatidylglycerol:prolipoprotein diacylglycerol transferase
MDLSFIIWNGSPDIFSIGPVTLRWYGLLFASGFLITQQILYYMFKKEGKPQADVDTLTIYMVVATILGARLGHIIFYDPEIIVNDPLGIFLPFEFKPEFKFTGLMGLASHGAAIGILFALWLYSRKRKPGQNYLQTLDRIVILVALTGALIRFGNFFNSEILGKPTDSPMGIVFINRVSESIEGDQDDPHNNVETVVVEKNKEMAAQPNGRVPVKIFIFFKPGVSENDARTFVQGQVKRILFNLSEFVDENPMTPIQFNTILDTKTNQVMARVDTLGISRHPAQLYEAISCILLFLLLLMIWMHYKQDLPEGRIFGYFMIILWSLRFVYEYLKEPQEAFELTIPLFMGQILSIPLVIIGIYFLIRSYRLLQPFMLDKVIVAAASVALVASGIMVWIVTSASSDAEKSQWYWSTMYAVFIPATVVMLYSIIRLTLLKKTTTNPHAA